MTIRSPHRRRLARWLCTMASALSAAMLLFSGAVLVTGGPTTAGAATAGGSPTIAPGSGGSGAEFTMTLPAGAACTGDTANGNYRVQSYIVAASIDPATLTFDANGPTSAATGTSLRQPLFGNDSVPYVNQGTSIAVNPGGPGLVSGLPSFSFAVFGPDVAAVVPPGTYNVGVACTLGNAGATQLDRYWNAQMTFTADLSDPGGVTWTASAAPTTTTTDGSGTTTTTDGSGTTTTTDGSGTTTTTTELVINVGPPLVLSSDTLSPGDSVTIQASGWEPSSDVVIVIHSDPVEIGTLSADANGAINGPVTIPADTPPGTHQIIALGLDPSGEPLGSAADVTVLAAAGSNNPTGGTPAAASPVTVMGQLPYTGSSPLPLVFWAVSLLVFGRLAMLLGKRPKVVGDGSP